MILRRVAINQDASWTIPEGATIVETHEAVNRSEPGFLVVWYLEEESLQHDSFIKVLRQRCLNENPKDDPKLRI